MDEQRLNEGERERVECAADDNGHSIRRPTLSERVLTPQSANPSTRRTNERTNALIAWRTRAPIPAILLLIIRVIPDGFFERTARDSLVLTRVRST